MDTCLLGWSGARVAAQPGSVPWACTLHHSATGALVPRTTIQGVRTHNLASQARPCKSRACIKGWLLLDGGSCGCRLMLPSRSCVQAQVPVEATSWGASANSFLGMLVCSLDKSSLHPRGARYQGGINYTTHNRDKWYTDKC
jgi:hypothetical protein